jgi:hypothetical protein
MPKTSNLDLCVSELRAAAQSLINAADVLTTLFSKSEAEPAKPESSKPVPVTLEKVRAVLAEKSRDGHTAKVRELLEKHGAAKLSEIDPNKYAVLLAEAEVLEDG